MQEQIRSLEAYHALVPGRSPSRPRQREQRRFSMARSAETEHHDETPRPPERSEDLRVSPPLEDDPGGRVDITA